MPDDREESEFGFSTRFDEISPDEMRREAKRDPQPKPKFSTEKFRRTLRFMSVIAVIWIVAIGIPQFGLLTAVIVALIFTPVFSLVAALIGTYGPKSDYDVFRDRASQDDNDLS